MKKDVIYVDIEDDITSIIDKVKAAEAQIVALVPPKRIGVLQSVVNLKLLQKAAKSGKKHVVLITNDQALSSLAAGVSMPVAKNLQSKPEIPQIAALDVDDEDVINGDELPVGDLAATAPVSKSDDEFDLPTPPPAKSSPVTTPFAATAAKNAPRKIGSKVPNFELFRKKVFLIAGGGVLLVVFLIWAIFFAPRATVAITARTNLVNQNHQLSLVPNGSLDTNQKVIPALVQQTKKTNSVDFDATGKKDVGDKAAGSVKMEVCGGFSAPAAVAAGTTVTSSGGKSFVTTATATFAQERIGNGCIVYSSSSVAISATAPGTSYNLTSASFSVGGRSDVTAQGSTSGGTDKTATVVSQADIDKAKEQLATQDVNKVKADLKKQFKGDVIIIDESFKVDAGNVASAPKVDEEATRAKLTSETTYTLVAISRSDLKKVLNTYLKTQINDDEQRIYADGDESANFSDFEQKDANYSVKIQTDGQVGPKIDDAALKPQLVGKRAGEIQQLVEGIQGVENVETSFSPFWVTKAPDAKKITIKFILKNDSN
jgi:hypothetical protein